MIAIISTGCWHLLSADVYCPLFFSRVLFVRPVFGFNRAWPFSVMPRLLFPYIVLSYCALAMGFLLIINRVAQVMARRNRHRALFFRYGI